MQYKVVPYLLESFHKCCGRNRSRTLIYILRTCQCDDIHKHIAFRKCYDVLVKSSEDGPPPCFLQQITRDPCLNFLEYVPTQGRRKPRRQRTLFTNYIHCFLGVPDSLLNDNQLFEMAQERHRWRKLVSTAPQSKAKDNDHDCFSRIESRANMRNLAQFF